ncbi:NPCBM/NEW2 domain-containing protein [Streptomyces sp. N2-109]|uniref:NPCBM/NEW2 domain-containing protein n=2 Tax=Streptomyces gossypii TaxID=2883101 RepID=A0ABT2JPB3_9ACTN|nr:NPCBM/NEW2 domain-containing protein [Streptomyces gossypii]
MWQRQSLRIDSGTHGRGGTVHARSPVTIDLNRACVAYDALTRLDKLTPVGSPVRFSGRGDDTRLWQSPAVTRDEPPVPVHLPVGGVRTLPLVVQAEPSRQPDQPQPSHGSRG